MDRRPVGQFLADAGEHFLEQRFRLLELVFLQRSQSSFVILQCLGNSRVVRDGGLLGVSLLSHVKNFSCARRNGGLLRPLSSKSPYSSITQRAGIGQLAEAVPSTEFASIEPNSRGSYSVLGARGLGTNS